MRRNRLGIEAGDAEATAALFSDDTDSWLLHTTKAGAEEMNRRLLVEKASLQSLARIEDEARTRLGMVAATYQQVQLAREFVRGGTVSAALGDRTAAATARAREPGRAPGRELVREPARDMVR